MGREGVKRAVDVVAAVAALILASPAVAIIAAAIRATMGRPVVFTQVRSGRDGEPFRLHKLRTMRDDHDANGNLRSDEARVTRFGGWLRATSLDELPELVNVLRGDMSLVGPRPLLPAYLDRYTPEQARRHEVRPGLTGRAQVEGRNVLTWEHRLALDVAYVDSWTLWGDAKLLARTLAAVAARRGVDQPGRVGADAFPGSASLPEMSSARDHMSPAHDRMSPAHDHTGHQPRFR